MQKIPFIHTLAADKESDWIAAIEAASPEVTVCPVANLTEAEKAEASVAIVANPDPSDLRHLPALRWVQSLWAGVERLVPQNVATASRIVAENLKSFLRDGSIPASVDRQKGY
jgi:glyoxylate/hydroxypyruvate reductase